MQNRVGRPFAATYELDKLGSKAPLNLPSATKTFSGNSTLERVRTLQRDSNVPNSLKERVASVLASEFSKKVRPPSSPFPPRRYRRRHAPFLPKLLDT